LGGKGSDQSTEEVKMWVFGYGSLMWDGWEAKRGCTRRVVADLPGFCRRFNKASVRNWGTESAPGPTLNLSKAAAGICRGIAFEFPDTQKAEILSYLEEREGKGFLLHERLVRIDGQSEVSAFVPLYNGKNVIEGKTVEEVAEMVLAASGTEGACFDYVNGIAEKLSALGIGDPAVTELWRAVNGHG
jgi:glutathione-specific gamma-glutamylcyclotransferase